MARHVCDNCGSVVTDEEFCPNCGSWIDTMVDGGEGDDMEAFRLGSTPPPDYDQPPARIPRTEIQCPSCGAHNPVGNRHCEECGARLSQAQLPVAPRPAVQSPAGVRAAMALAALLGSIVFIALLFNLFRDDTAETTTAETVSTSTTAPPLQNAPVNIIGVECSIEGYSGFDCDNVREGGAGEYQFNWEAVPGGQKVTITLTFDQAYQIRSIVWENLPDSNRYYQNYRAKALTVSDLQTTGIAAPIELKDQPGATTYAYVSVSTSKLEIEITNAYPAEEREGQIYSDFAVVEIQVLGSPVIVGSTATTPASNDTTTTTQG